MNNLFEIIKWSFKLFRPILALSLGFLVPAALFILFASENYKVCGYGLLGGGLFFLLVWFAWFVGEIIANIFEGGLND